MAFQVIDINTHPQDTGVEQYINFEVAIACPDTMYADDADTEIYAGESIGEL